MPHSVGVIEAYDDVPNEPLLTHVELVELQRVIEAGLLAKAARLSGAGFADATEQELILLEDQGALARQRFIEANLGLVGMVSRQFAARCQLPEAELFQEGCLGLPACQLPTGSSPWTSPSALHLANAILKFAVHDHSYRLPESVLLRPSLSTESCAAAGCLRPPLCAIPGACSHR